MGPKMRNKSMTDEECLIFVLVFNWNHFEDEAFNLRINFYLLQTFPLHLGSFCVVSSFTTFRPNFGARGAADRGVESLRFQVSIVRR